MISGNRDEAWPMYLAWPIPERFMLGVIRWHVTCMLSLAEHWQGRRALSNHVCAHSVIPMWHVVCLQHLARAGSEQSRSTTVLPINHVIQIPQCLSGFVNHDYYQWHKWCPCKRSWSEVKLAEVKTNFASVWAFSDHNSKLNSLMVTKWGTKGPICQTSRSHGTKNRQLWPELSVSGLWLQFEKKQWLWNDA